jgi:hypothetical protein
MKKLLMLFMLFAFVTTIAQQSYSVIKTDNYGFPVKTGEIVQVNDVLTDFYVYSDLGIPVKTQTAISDYNNNVYVYEYDNLGQQRQTTQILNNNNFQYQSYNVNQNQFNYRYEQPAKQSTLPVMQLLPIISYDYDYN